MHRADRTEQRDRVEAQDVRRARQDVGRMTRHRLGVGPEHQVEAPSFGKLREFGVVAEAVVELGVGVGMALRRGVVAGPVHERPELHLPRHRTAPVSGRRRSGR